MKKLIKNVCAALLAAGLMLNAAGCGEKNEYSDVIDGMGDIAEEDLPYGATITQLKTDMNENVRISIEYDGRFMTEEEAIKISDYIAALNSCDAELMEQTVYPGYLSFLCRNSGVENTAEYLSIMHDNLRDSYIGGEFDFNYILTNSCLDESASDDETGFDQLDSILDGIGEGKLSEKVTSRKLIGLDIMYALDEKEGSYSLSYRTGSDQMVYVYNIDGQLYIL